MMNWKIYKIYCYHNTNYANKYTNKTNHLVFR